MFPSHIRQCPSPHADPQGGHRTLSSTSAFTYLWHKSVNTQVLHKLIISPGVRSWDVIMSFCHALLVILWTEAPRCWYSTRCTVCSGGAAEKTVKNFKLYLGKRRNCSERLADVVVWLTKTKRSCCVSTLHCCRWSSRQRLCVWLRRMFPCCWFSCAGECLWAGLRVTPIPLLTSDLLKSHDTPSVPTKHLEDGVKG